MGSIATCYWRAGNLDKALEVYEQVKDFREQINDKSAFAMALMNMGEIYGGKNNYEKALSMIVEGLHITLLESSLFQKIIGYNQLIGLLIRTGQVRQAIKAELELLDLIILEGDYNRFFEELIHISEQARMINAYDLSEQLCNEAINLAKIIDNRSYQNRVLFELAKVEKDKKNYDLAQQKYEEIVINSKKLNDHRTVEETLYEHGLLLEEMGNFPMAVLKLGECEKYTQNTGNTRLAQQCKDLQGRWMIGTILKGAKDKGFGKKEESQKDSVPDIKKKDKKIIIDTRFFETLPLFASVDNCQLSYDNTLALFSPVDYSIKVWDLQNAEKVIDHDQRGNFISSWATFVPNTHRVITAYYQRNLWEDRNVVNVVRFYPVQTIDGKFKIVNYTGFSLDCKDSGTNLGFITESGKKVFTLSNSQGLEAWDTESGELIQIAKTLHYYTSNLIAADFNGEKIFCYRGGNLEVWNYNDSYILEQFIPHVHNFLALSIAPDLSKIAYETKKGDYEVWDIKTQSQLAVFPIREISKKDEEKKIYYHKFYKNERYAFNSDGTLFGFYGQDGRICICDIYKKQVIKHFSGPGKSVACINFSPDSSKFLVSTYRQESYIYDLI
ncbi:MAG: tetratricopeptide repeat protein [Promethearchaeota archaeon]